VRRGFETLDARLEVDHGCFERTMAVLDRAHPAIQFGVRELDHRLRVGEAAIHPVIQLGDLLIELLIDPNDSFRNELYFVFQSLRSDVKVMADVDGVGLQQTLQRRRRGVWMSAERPRRWSCG
jgi:hypothetical protein